MSEIYLEDRLMEGDPMRSFEDPRCWQECRQLEIFVVREILPILPKEERFRLGDQMIRSARSTTANIAEGYGRLHYADNAKFVSNARGSCHETPGHRITALDEGMIRDRLLSHSRTLYNPAILPLNGYLACLQNAASSQ